MRTSSRSDNNNDDNAQLDALLQRCVPHRTLTKVQATVLPTMLHSDANVLVAAPTGSGKTLLMEAAMLRLFRARLQSTMTTTTTQVAAADTSDAHDVADAPAHAQLLHAKVVYVCPMRALAHEKYTQWRTRFPALHIVLETGDAAAAEHDDDDDDDDSDDNSDAPARDERRRHARSNNTDTATMTTQTRRHDADASLRRVAAADVVIATPERWDSVTRRGRAHGATTTTTSEARAVMCAVALLLLDEVHTVAEDRGAALEAVVSRMMAVKATHTTNASSSSLSSSSSSSSLPLRIVAVSGTLPNVHDFAAWLHVRAPHVYTFSNADRPVPLTVRVLAYADDGRGAFAFDRFLSYKLLGLLRQYSAGRPTLVFCLSRRASVTTAQQLVHDLTDAAARDGHAALLTPSADAQAAAARASDRQLRACLPLGIAFHHAALSPCDRALVEALFRGHRIAVLCTTTTLALGVNLPARLVIVKGTAVFARGGGGGVMTHATSSSGGTATASCVSRSRAGEQHYALSEVTQMCGRAGRPGLDDVGVALVLTTESAAPRYASLAHNNNDDSVSGDSVAAAAPPCESRLHVHLIEHVNAEVALRTTHSLASALAWVRTTFLWQRLRQCPQHYGVRLAATATATTATQRVFDAEDYVRRLMSRVLDALARVGCVTCAPTADNAVGGDTCAPTTTTTTTSTATLTNVLLESTPLGRCMSRMYMLYDTVRLFVDEATAAATTTLSSSSSSATPRRRPPHSFASTLALLSRSAEFVDARLRLGDRGPLNALHRLVPLPLHMAALPSCVDDGDTSRDHVDSATAGRKRTRTRATTTTAMRRAVREDWHKIYLLVQAYVLQLPVADVSLRNDMHSVWALVPRLAAFLCHVTTLTSAPYALSRHADVLRRCVQRRVWPDEHMPATTTTTTTQAAAASSSSTTSALPAWLRQLRGVSASAARCLYDAGYADAASLCRAQACRIELLCGRVPPFGARVRRGAAALLPRCVVAVLPAAQARTATCRRNAAQAYVVRLTFDHPHDDDDDDDDDDGDCDNDAATRRQQPRRQLQLLVGHVARDVVLLRRLVDVPARGGDDDGVVEYAFVLPRGASVDDVVAHVSVPHVVGCDVVARGVATTGATTTQATTTTAAAVAPTPSYDAFLADLRAIDACAGGERNNAAATPSPDDAPCVVASAATPTTRRAQDDETRQPPKRTPRLVRVRACASPEPAAQPLPSCASPSFARLPTMTAHYGDVAAASRDVRTTLPSSVRAFLQQHQQRRLQELPQQRAQPPCGDRFVFGVAVRSHSPPPLPSPAAAWQQTCATQRAAAAARDGDEDEDDDDEDDEAAAASYARRRDGYCAMAPRTRRGRAGYCDWW